MGRPPVSYMVMGQQPFETVVEAHHAEIYRYLVRVTTRPSEAEDLSQETFLRAYRAYRALTPDANVRAWLFTIATNLTRNHFRTEGRRRSAHAAFRETRPELRWRRPGGRGPFQRGARAARGRGDELAPQAAAGLRAEKGPRS